VTSVNDTSATSGDSNNHVSATNNVECAGQRRIPKIYRSSIRISSFFSCVGEEWSRIAIHSSFVATVRANCSQKCFVYFIDIGSEVSIEVNEKHAVNGNRTRPPFPAGSLTAMFGMYSYSLCGCQPRTGSGKTANTVTIVCATWYTIY